MKLIDIDKWQEIFNSIWRHKLRTILTAFGVAWGIFIIVIMLGAINGLRNSFEYDFRDDAVNSLWIYGGTTSKAYKGLREGRRIFFDNDDYDFLINQFEEIDAITGRFYLSSTTLVKFKQKILSFNVRSVHPGHKVLENTKMIHGRYLNDNDIKHTEKVAVIGKFVSQDLFGAIDPIGKEMSIGDIVYKVVGVFYDSGGENEMRKIYIPITTAQKVYSGGSRIHQLMVDGGDLSVEEMESLEKRILTAFAERKIFDRDDNRAINIYNRAADFQQFASLFNAFSWISRIVGVFSVLAGVIAVSNIMLIIVKDRTKEIGIRKAIGATPGSIIAMILQESVFITAIAGYVGMVAGIFFIFLVKDIESPFFRRPEVNLGVILIATFVLILSGALAGLIPAIQAARINPVTAIRAE